MSLATKSARSDRSKKGGDSAAPSHSSSPQKRKRDDDVGDAEAAKKALKKQKRKEKKKQKVYDDNCDEELGINKSIALMNGQLLADFLGRKTKRFEADLSAVELEDRRVSASAFTDTTSWDKPRTTENLPLFLERVGGPRLADTAKENGSPHTLVVAGAGLRAADLTRALRKFQTKDALVAKLFAKHIKINEQIGMCKKHRINIGVGTPQRISDLLDDGALSTKNLQRIVVDASHIDQKKRTVLDMRETQVPLVKLLVRADLKERYGRKKKGIELLFY